MVGALVVRGKTVVGSGWHRRAGGPHAEVIALEEAGEAACGATLYVNLEPCAHQGRTPPCTERIRASGVSRVVASLEDPDPRVSGRGFAALRGAGIEVQEGLLEEEARRLNEAYLTQRREGRPFVTAKLAATLDGRLAARTRASRWITGEEARRRAHELRAAHDAVLVGIGTVIADDPRLTPRTGAPIEGPPRLRVIADSGLRLPAEGRLARSARESPVVVYTGPGGGARRRAALEEAGLEVVELPLAPGGIDLRALLEDLARREIVSVLAEGGGRLVGGLLARGLVDKVAWFVAPLILGDAEAVPAVAGLAPSSPREGIRLVRTETETVGEDLLLVGYPVRGAEEV
jgi:diaminohydroxyphosphoribosylaminopyrimidine deaminase/5-amino-6-(5-phosphoribosylamino)uracil reductase